MPWYRFLLSLSQLTGGSEVSLGDLQKGPPALTIDEIGVLVDKASAALGPSQDGLLAQLAELRKQVDGLSLAPPILPPEPDAPIWIDLVSRPSTLAGTSTVSGVSGDVRLHVKVGKADVYRFIPSPYDPLLDAFYSSFVASVLSGLIVVRA